MAPTNSKVYLISGSNRGIGFGLVEQLLTRKDAIVYAGCRDPIKADKLTALQNTNKNLRIVKLVSADLESNKAAITQIEKEAGKLNVVIANAGIAGEFGPIAKQSIKNFQETYEVNTIGPLMLFQSASHLLDKNENSIFAVVSSGIGSIGAALPYQAGGYGSSKAAVNWVTRQIALEHKDIIAFCLHPGWVETDMGNAGAAGAGLKSAPHTIKECTDGILGLVDGATKESSGKFFNAIIKDTDAMWDIKDATIPW